MTTMVTLATGEAVDSADPAWRDECLSRHRHVQEMRSLTLQGRRDYIAAVRRAEGDESAHRLMDAFSEDWQQRRGVANTGEAKA